MLDESGGQVIFYIYLSRSAARRGLRPDWRESWLRGESSGDQKGHGIKGRGRGGFLLSIMAKFPLIFSIYR
jgi:hypothetical protein